MDKSVRRWRRILTPLLRVEANQDTVANLDRRDGHTRSARTSPTVVATDHHIGQGDLPVIRATLAKALAETVSPLSSFGNKTTIFLWLSICVPLKRLRYRQTQTETTMKLMMVMIPAVYQDGKPAPKFTSHPRRMEERGGATRDWAKRSKLNRSKFPAMENELD